MSSPEKVQPSRPESAVEKWDRIRAEALNNLTLEGETYEEVKRRRELDSLVSQLEKEAKLAETKEKVLDTYKSETAPEKTESPEKADSLPTPSRAEIVSSWIEDRAIADHEEEIHEWLHQKQENPDEEAYRKFLRNQIYNRIRYIKSGYETDEILPTLLPLTPNREGLTRRESEQLKELRKIDKKKPSREYKKMSETDKAALWQTHANNYYQDIENRRKRKGGTIYGRAPYTPRTFRPDTKSALEKMAA